MCASTCAYKCLSKRCCVSLADVCLLRLVQKRWIVPKYLILTHTLTGDNCPWCHDSPPSFVAIGWTVGFEDQLSDDLSAIRAQHYKLKIQACLKAWSCTNRHNCNHPGILLILLMVSQRNTHSHPSFVHPVPSSFAHVFLCIKYMYLSLPRSHAKLYASYKVQA